MGSNVIGGFLYRATDYRHRWLHCTTPITHFVLFTYTWELNFVHKTVAIFPLY